MSRNSYYAGDPFAETSTNSFIVPIQQSNSSQGNNLHLGTSSLSLSGDTSSTRTYRYSTSVEAGDYRHLQQQEGAQLGHGVSRSLSMQLPPGSSSRSRASSSSTRMVYSPNPPTTATSDGGGIGATPRTEHLSHYRASPSLSTTSHSSTTANNLPPQAGLMRRGTSYDGGAAPSPSRHLHQLSSTSTNLLPTSYTSSGYSPSPMTGVQSTSPSSARSAPALVDYSQQQQQQQAPPAPPPQRHSYSPSHYAASSSSAAAHPPPPPSSSFYPHHIPLSSSTSPVPPPPPQSRTPAHHPQAQQYYQSQQYLDANLSRQAANAQAARGAGGAPHQQQQQQHAGASSSSSSAVASSSSAMQQQQPQQQQQQQNNAAAMYYAQGTDLRSAATVGASSSSSSRARSQGRGGPSGHGLRRVRDTSEIARVVNAQPAGRRADPAGGFISPLKALTTHLPQTYNLVNPAFRYETSFNPRRVLTKPSKPASNDGFDNEDSDYILYVNDVLGSGEGKGRYLILDVLGQGTFGQVVKCQNLATHEIVAVKVVKNKPAYFQQSMMEVTILELINNQWDPADEHHMLRLKDTFIHHSHLCLVFELLSNNLYELIKQNSFRGLSTSLVRVFTAQLLDALTVLQEAKIIHCDLKPENILLKSLQSPTIKVIDFGSACHEKQTVYTYIQSRFYRSPEVILSLPYAASIDMWSLGCICVELFLGLPLFPGTSEFNQITRIVEMLGMPADHMLDKGKQTANFFDQVSDEYGRRRWRLKSLERYSAEFKTQEQPSKKYFSATTLPEIIKQYPIVRKGLKEAEVDKEMKNRIAFIDFVKGLLNLDPETRWSPQQARLHPFVLGEPLLQPFVPPPILKTNFGGSGGSSKPSGSSAPTPTSPNPAADPSRPYGGLPTAPQRSAPGRTYDAKSYSQHLTQQQGYTMQAQQQQQAQQRVPTNPYQLSDGLGGPLQGGGFAPQQQQQQQRAQSMNQQQQQQYASAATAAGGFYPPPSSAPALGGGGVGVANPPAAVHHYGGGTTRGRSNTAGGQDNSLPPALRQYGQELGVGGGGHAGTGASVTPVLRREDQWQAWERLTGGGQGDGASGVQRRISISRNPHLNLLQEQAENNSWNSPMRAKPNQQQQQPLPQQPYSSYYQSPIQAAQQQFSIVVDGRQQQQQAPPPQQQQPGNDLFDVGIAAPPLAYNSATNPARYAPYSTGAGAGVSNSAPPPSATAGGVGGYELPFDAFDQRDGLGGMYQPLQPFQAGGGGGGSARAPGGGALQPSLYAGQVPSAGGVGGVGLFGAPPTGAQQQQQGKGKGW